MAENPEWTRINKEEQQKARDAQAAKVPDQPVEQPQINVAELIDKITTRIMAWRQQGVTRSPRDEAVDYVEYVLAELRYGSPKREAVAQDHIVDANSMIGWQPIATAPQTSKSYLVYCPDRRNIYVVSFNKKDERWEHFGAYSNPLHEFPTHWMPLPKDPTEIEGGE